MFSFFYVDNLFILKEHILLLHYAWGLLQMFVWLVIVLISVLVFTSSLKLSLSLGRTVGMVLLVILALWLLRILQAETLLIYFSKYSRFHEISVVK